MLVFLCRVIRVASTESSGGQGAYSRPGCSSDNAIEGGVEVALEAIADIISRPPFTLSALDAASVAPTWIPSTVPGVGGGGRGG